MPHYEQHQLDPQGLEAYFTDVEHLRSLFETWVAEPELPKQVLIIHGIGGVGKSSLLRIFRLHCKKEGVPVTPVFGDECRSTLDVIETWANDLNTDDVKLPTLSKTLHRYRAILAKVTAEEKTKRALGKAASKTAEAVGSAAVGAAVGSVVPGIGTTVGAVMGGVFGVGAEALVDWLRGQGLSKPDIDLLLDPTGKLTDDFLTDLAHVASRQRVVLMLDTYEQLKALEDWTCDLRKRLHANVLLVIAGRAVPNWRRRWPGWLAQAQLEELKPMSEEDMGELVRRYYATIRSGEPDPKQVEAIIRFARGLPMVVTSAVELWVQYGVEDFQAVKPQVVADLVDQLMEGVPKEMIPALEGAAVVRWFDKPILRAVMGQKDVDAVYDELRRFPFVRPRVEGWMLHDAVREIMDENLRVSDSQRHCELHQRAATYFEAQLAGTQGKEREQFVLERFYHLIQSGDESIVITESRAAIETALGYYRRPFAESVMSLLEHYLQQGRSRLWLGYLRYRVTLMNPDIDNQVAESRSLATLMAKPGLNPELRAAIAIVLQEAPGEANISSERRMGLLRESIDSGYLDPNQKAKAHWQLGMLYRAVSDWQRTLKNLDLANKLYDSQNDPFGQEFIADAMAYTFFLMGEWARAEESAQRAVDLSRKLGDFGLSNSLKTLGWIQTYRGKLSAALSAISESLELARQQHDEAQIIRASRRLAEIYDRQKRWTLSVALYKDLIATDEGLGRVLSGAWLKALLGVSLLNQGLYAQAKQLFLDSLAHDYIEIEQIALNGLGELHFVLGEYAPARECFDRYLNLSKARPYYCVQALLGLLKVDAAQLAFGGMLERQQQIGNLLLKHTYDDHLASLCLVQGHVTWDGHIPEWGSGFDDTLRYYQHALVYALRYNRFLLDEMLSGQPQGTTLQPIIPHCVQRGEEGMRMLIALRDWWKTGMTDIDTPRPDTISPISEGIPLLEAERIAREREPGDDSPQRTVVEQIEVAFSDAGAT